MLIQTLQLSQFRNYERALFQFHPGLNILVGENGAGKTSVLEALYFASYLKSFRVSGRGVFESVVKEGKDSFSILLSGMKKDGPYSFLLRQTREKRFLEWDGKVAQKPQAVFGRIPIMFFSSRDLELVYASPEKRRVFFDDIISLINASYRRLLLDYRKLVLHRNCELRLGKASTRWDMLLVEKGYLVVKARLSFLQIILPLFKTLLRAFFSPSHLVALELRSGFEYSVKKRSFSKSGGDFGVLPQSFSFEAYAALFKQQLLQDSKYGFTTFGPQTDDYNLFLRSKPLLSVASQGEMRIFLYALKFTFFEYFKKVNQSSPILLLDDIFTDFDEEKVSRFLNYLKRQKQAFLSLASERLLGVFSNYSLFRLKRNEKSVSFVSSKKAI